MASCGAFWRPLRRSDRGDPPEGRRAPGGYCGSCEPSGSQLGRSGVGDPCRRDREITRRLLWGLLTSAATPWRWKSVPAGQKSPGSYCGSGVAFSRPTAAPRHGDPPEGEDHTRRLLWPLWGLLEARCGALVIEIRRRGGNTPGGCCGFCGTSWRPLLRPGMEIRRRERITPGGC